MFDRELGNSRVSGIGGASNLTPQLSNGVGWRRHESAHDAVLKTSVKYFVTQRGSARTSPGCFSSFIRKFGCLPDGISRAGDDGFVSFDQSDDLDAVAIRRRRVAVKIELFFWLPLLKA